MVTKTQLIAAFRNLTAKQQQEFFKQVVADKTFPPAVRAVAAGI